MRPRSSLLPFQHAALALPALLALLASTASPAFAQTAPWKQYLGANTAAGFAVEPWRATARGGYPLGSNNASIASTINPARLDEVLADGDWVHLQDGYNYRSRATVDAFFNAIRADHGAGWRANCTQLAQAMVDGQVRNAATGHKAYWELGNEIYADNPGETIGGWIAANNLPYPHPNSPYNDNPTHVARANDRGIIGYQVEYQMALALEAILAVNATAPAGHKIRILTPASTGSSIQNGAASSWTATLLNYVIVGYEVEKDANGNPVTNRNKPLAASLAGRRLGDLVDIVNVHYILGAGGAALNTVFNTWTGGTNRATGVFHTEEGGINAANGGRGGLSAMNNFARAMNVWLTRGLTPADARLIYYASGDGPVGTRGRDALTELHNFMPGDTTVLTRKPDLLSSGTAALETYTFENQDATKRALFIMPGGNTATTLTSVTMLAGGWNWTAVAGTARVWSSVTNAASTATVARSSDGSSYTISFPSVRFTQANQQALVIFLTGSSPTALAILTPATLPFGAVNAAYAQTLAAAGATASATWSITAGALPAGLTLSSAGVLSGTPTATGTFNFTAQVTSAGATATRAFSVRIDTVTALTFATGATLRPGTVGTSYQDGLSVTGGTAPYRQAVTAGALPPGLSLGSNGLLSGTPTTAGTFTFTSTVTDAVGATASRNFTVVIAGGTTGTGSAASSRLVNLSILSALTAGETMTMGAVIGGAGTSGAKPLLARAAGPSLSQFGTSDPLPDPKMSLVASAGSTVVASNNDWGTSAATLTTAFAQTGAFAFLSTASRDAAIFTPQLSAGDYTVLVSDNATGTGSVIAELYDATPSASFTAATPRLINVSVLKQLGTGLTAGFVVGGTGTKTLLIRAIGPTLGAAPFNVAGAVSDPQLTLYSGQTAIGANDNWGGTAALTTAFGQVGAFALPAGSRDAALLTALSPGNYTVLVSGGGGQTGVALIEIYEVP